LLWPFHHSIKVEISLAAKRHPEEDWPSGFRVHCFRSLKCSASLVGQWELGNLAIADKLFSGADKEAFCAQKLKRKWYRPVTGYGLVD